MTLLSDNRIKRPTGTVARPGQRVAAVVAPTNGMAGRVVQLPANHRRTGMVFEVLLGLAACLSLVAVIHSGTEISSSPDAPAPAVFVQTD